jgi:hypothetical protein
MRINSGRDRRLHPARGLSPATPIGAVKGVADRSPNLSMA